jgi:hypothetical protein
MRNSVILATISNPSGLVQNITISQYNTMLANKNKKDIAEMVYHRFYGRYIKPFLFDDRLYKKHYKHGFLMMASACLIIEALESFYQGWEETQTRGEQVFESFFAKDLALRKFRGVKFYKHIRCGILHQAETTGGFTIVRRGDLFDSAKKRINAQKFLDSLERSLMAYKEQLLNSVWDSEIWDNFRRKMRFIIRHCGGCSS